MKEVNKRRLEILWFLWISFIYVGLVLQLISVLMHFKVIKL